MQITINDEPFDFAGEVESPDHAAYESVVALAGFNPTLTPSVTYRTTRKGDEQRSGILSPGRIVRIEDGMGFAVVHTGRA